MKKLYDKSAIVTGGASGIGRALCENLAKYGAIVTVADIDHEGTGQLAKSIVSSGGKAEAVTLDVTKKADVEKLVNETAQTRKH